MKINIKNISYGLLVCFSLTACNSFLDESPDSELTNENWGSGDKNSSTVYTTATQMEQLLAGAYNLYGNEFWQLDWYIMNDAQSDNAYAGEQKEQTMQIDEFRIESTNDIVKRDWKYLYEQITRANTIIEWAPKITDSALTEARCAQMLGEARFMRAFAYFNLVRIYENVPLITKYVPEINLQNIDELYPLIYPEQAPIENVYSQIIEDLEFAEKNAPDYSEKKFKITKAFVNLVMAQVYATKDGFANTNWTKVREYAKAVVDDTRYGLMDNYNDLFAPATPSTDGSLPSSPLMYSNTKESIFEVEYSSWATLGNWGAQMFYGVDWKKYNTPSQDLNSAFNKEGDTIRKDGSIVFGDVTGRWTDKYWPSNKYPYCYKLRAQESANIVLFRLPEAILLLAEAENELGNITEAKRLLNLVRSRVNLANTTATTKDNLSLAIENEHRFEFAFEGNRWMYLKRRGRFIEVMKKSTDHQRTYAANLNENRLIWPIPQEELDLNENLIQNKGY